MASVEKTEVFDVDINTLYDTIVDYHSYPEFVAGVDKVEVISQSDSGAEVKYKLNVIKSFAYTLKHTHQKPNKVSWVLESGDLFKKNDGHWELKDLGNGKTEVTYALDLDFKVLVPKMILNKLTSSNLPGTLKAFHDRAKGK